jgi:hypothetical protein
MRARDNPFRVSRVLTAIRYEIPADAGAGAGAIALLPRLEALRYRAAIVGPHGSGKTTLLEDLASVLAARGFRTTFVRLDADDRRLPREWRSSARLLDARDIICLDGAEQLTPIAWRHFRWQARRAGGLIITTHKPGRLTTLIECTTSVNLLQRIIQRLAPDACDASEAPDALDAPGGLVAARPPVAELFARHRGNLRDALRELYDVYAATPF